MFELDCDLHLTKGKSGASHSVRIAIRSGPGVWMVRVVETTCDPARAAECHETLMKMADDLVEKGYKLRGRRTRPLSGP